MYLKVIVKIYSIFYFCIITAPKSISIPTVIFRVVDNWLNLAFLESLAIKDLSPELNKGIKSCKDLSLF